MLTHLAIFILSILSLGLHLNGVSLYSSYTLLYDPLGAREWSDNSVLVYVTTVRLLKYNHHLFQYRHYPCQYFYTDEIQMKHTNETKQECIYNPAKTDYEYKFQLYLDSRRVERYLIRNIALQCKYINCSLSLLNRKYLRIGWNKQERNNNADCSFNTSQKYLIDSERNSLTEWITVRCKSLLACNRSKYNLEKALSSNIQIIYGSSFALEKPYCSLVKSVAYLIESNFAQTNRLLAQLVELIQRGFGTPDKRQQASMKEYIARKWVRNGTNSTMNTTVLFGGVQGVFEDTN